MNKDDPNNKKGGWFSKLKEGYICCQKLVQGCPINPYQFMKQNSKYDIASKITIAFKKKRIKSFFENWLRNFVIRIVLIFYTLFHLLKIVQRSQKHEIDIFH